MIKTVITIFKKSYFYNMYRNSNIYFYESNIHF